MNLILISLNHIQENIQAYSFYMTATLIALFYLYHSKWRRSLFFYILGIFAAFFYPSILGYMQGLGSDSFHEASSFDIQEAYFFLTTFLQIVEWTISFKALLLYTAISVLIFILLIFFFKFSGKIFNLPKINHNRAPFALLIISLLPGFYGIFTNYINSSSDYQNLLANFDTSIQLSGASTELNVMLYIGESTSSMNMEIYGYPRNTTPKLKRLKFERSGFLQFENIFATHTHTSPSLLEALSIGTDPADDFLPITQRKRVSIIDVLQAADINTKLYSNQGNTGTWNYASSIIFGNSQSKFSNENKYAGNSDNRIKKPFDHLFFNDNITTQKLDSLSKSFITFHSYAGHGPYLKNIPIDFRKPVDSLLNGFSTEALFGNANSKKSLLDSYDSAISYIDFSVSNAIEVVDQSNKPWVFIYFADHGESVFTNRAHDSARFIQEMIAVPLIIYFNDAARNLMPLKFKKYKNLSNQKNISTLAGLPATIFDLMGVEIKDFYSNQSILGSKNAAKPILIRNKMNKLSAINLSKKVIPKSLAIDKSNGPKHLIATETYEENDVSICYHRSNSIAKVLRGSMVANCLELDISIETDGKVFVHHPPAINSGLELSSIFSITDLSKVKSIWLDGKNISSKKNCYFLVESLKKNKPPQLKTLIEFPTYSHQQSSDIRNCITELEGTQLGTPSYYVDTADAVSCSLEISKQRKFNKISACVSLKADMLEMDRSALFNNVSFDYKGIKAIESIPLLGSYSWNIWNVQASELNDISTSRFKMIILKNDDPNNM